MKTQNKVFIDARMINGSGISTYTLNLLHEYTLIEHGLTIELLLKDYDALLPHKEIAQNYSQHLFDESIYSIGEQIKLPAVLKQKGILHVPHYNAPLFYKGKLIITVHDICHHAMKEFFPGIAKRIYSSIFLKRVLNRADQIITVSEFSKSEIQKYFKIDSKKIKVIHLGVDPHFSPRSPGEVDLVKQKYKLPESYLLYVGNIRPHKNISGMIQAYGLAYLENHDLPPFVLCGSKQDGYDVFSGLQNFSPSEQEVIKKNILFTSYVSYEDLPALYTGAVCFLFLSYYEGFGLPPLEAIACQTAVIASNLSSIPEVLGENALFASPYDPDDMAKAIKFMMTDSGYRTELVNKAKELLQKYSWQKTAEQHLKIYKHFLSSNDVIPQTTPSEKRKILFLEQFGNHIGGGQVILLDILRHLKLSKQWDISISLPEEGVFTQMLKKEGFHCIINPAGSHSFNAPVLIDIFRYVVSSWKSARQLSAYIKKEQIKLIYCNGGRTFLISLLLSFFTPVKIIWHLHLILTGRQKIMVSWFGRFPSIYRIISVSQTAGKPFKKNRVFSKIQTIHNWISPGFLTSPSNKRSRNERSLKCLIVGQISKEKGQLQLLQQLQTFEKAKITLDFAGVFGIDMKHEETLKDTIDQLNQRGNHKVRLLGFQSDIKSLLSNYDYLILPSLAPESFGLVAIEAMSRGVIVIANKIGALPEIMEHGKEGFFYDAEDQSSLANLFNEILGDKYDLKSIVQNALHRVKTEFHPSSQLGLIEHLLLQASKKAGTA